MHAKLRTGTLFAGRFLVEQLHAEDALGEFWNAVDKQTNARVTLRTLPPETGLTRREVNECLAAIEKARPLEHPCAVVPFELFKDGDRVVAVSRRIRGRSLSALRMGHPSKILDPGDIEAIAAAVAEAMEAAHRLRVTHGGLRPDIIFIAEDGGVQIADFGLGGAVTRAVLQNGHKRLGAAIAPFVSHTLARGEGPYLTDDIYAFGATMYVSLTGAHPLTPEKAHVWSKPRTPRAPVLINERRRRASGRHPPAPSVWEQVILSCLDRDGFARPQRFSAVAGMLAPAPARIKEADAQPDVEAPAGIPEPARETQETETPAWEESRESPLVAAGNKPAAIATAHPKPAMAADSGSRNWSDPIAAEFWGDHDFSGPPRAATRRAPRQMPPPARRDDYDEPPEGPRKSGVFLRVMVALVALSLLGLAVYHTSIEHARHSARDELLTAIQGLPAQPSPAQIEAVQLQLDQRRGELDATTWGALTSLWRERRHFFATAATGDSAAPSATPASPVATAPEPAPAQPKTPAATGALTVRTLPIGARIQVGDAEPQRGPAVVDNLPAGRLQLTVSADGYITKETTVDIVSGQTRNIDVALERAIGTASLTSTTPGLPFEISSPASDLVLQSGVTPRDISLPTGEYTVVFTLPDEPPVARALTITHEGTARVAIDYSPPAPPAPEPGVGETTPGLLAPPPLEAMVGNPPAPASRAASEPAAPAAPFATTGPAAGIEQPQPRIEPLDTPPEPPQPADVAPPVEPEAPAPESNQDMLERAPAEENPAEHERAETADDRDSPGIIVVPAPMPEIAAPPTPTPPTADPSLEEAPPPVGSEDAVAENDGNMAAPPTAVDEAPIAPPAAETTARESNPPSRAPEDEPSPPGDAAPAQPAEPAREAIDTDRLYSLSDVDTRPVLLEREEPKAPRRFNRENGVGSVRLSVIIDRDGFISAIRVTEATDRRLAEACIEAVRYWRFSPARIGGQRVAVRAVLPFVFR